MSTACCIPIENIVAGTKPAFRPRARKPWAVCSVFRRAVEVGFEHLLQLLESLLGDDALGGGSKAVQKDHGIQRGILLHECRQPFDEGLVHQIDVLKKVAKPFEAPVQKIKPVSDPKGFACHARNMDGLESDRKAEPLVGLEIGQPGRFAGRGRIFSRRPGKCGLIGVGETG